MNKRLALIAIAASSLLLSGCAAALIGGGAAGGYYATEHKKEIGEYSDDSWITSKIKSKYLTTSGIRSMNISVSTNNGVVTLAGQVKNPHQHQQAIQIAKSTKGVRKVDARNLVITNSRR